MKLSSSKINGSFGGSSPVEGGKARGFSLFFIFCFIGNLSCDRVIVIKDM